MRVLRHQAQRIEHLFRDRASRGNFASKLAQLLGIGQFALEQKTRDHFEALFFRHFVNVGTAIRQACVRIDPADFCLACDYARETWTVSWLGFFSCHRFSRGSKPWIFPDIASTLSLHEGNHSQTSARYPSQKSCAGS